MTPARFIAKWSRATLSERSASQQHFIDLCRLLGQPAPAEHDATGAEYTFEKGVTVTDGASRGAKGDNGYADVWWKDKFAWEYKRKDKYKDLTDAYRQLCQYREALGNPPLLVVCDITRTDIHTNFTRTVPQVHTILLPEMDQPEKLDLLRRVFTNPDSFCPTVTPEKVTEEVAKSIASLARSLQGRGHEPHATAHFLMKCMFCLFAEDVTLLPDKLFSHLLKDWHDQPAELAARLTELFDKMRTGGAFGRERIAWFNGGLFDQSPALPLEYDEIGLLRIAAGQNWGSVEPAIFGTLFERSLDPTKRAQIGAHYTGRDDIMLIVEPVVMSPLRRQWQTVKDEVEKQIERRRAGKTKDTKKKADQAINDLLQGFLNHLASLRILDSACGSGNFLYVAIQQLLDLEKEVITFAARPDIGLGLFPTVRPTQLHGIEINPYAAELAQVVIWIGYLQWMRDNGFNTPRDPILQPLQSIENRDAILDLSDPKNPAPAKWPETDFIIGNPPFLGDKLMRQHMGDDYVDALRGVYEGRIPGGADLCTYWFEQARERIAIGACKRAGLLATQHIRGGANRMALDRIKQTGDIFYAVSDREWVLDGANVNISMIGFDDGSESERMLDGNRTTAILANLTSTIDLPKAKVLPENSIGFIGSCKGGAFDITWREARTLLGTGGNPNRRSNSDVLRPLINSQDLVGRTEPRWIIDNADLDLEKACMYQAPHSLVEQRVKPSRASNRDRWLRENWWRPQRMRPEMRAGIAGLPRFLVTPTTSKHRIFAWLYPPYLPDHKLVIVAREDDYCFGVLQSAVHELWALATGTRLEDRPNYNPTMCLETFRLPWLPGKEPVDDPLHKQISQAAAELNEIRERWLNPPEWIEPIARAIDAADSFADVPAEARPLIRQSAIMAAAAKDVNLKRRTLTNLYNERPTWLKLAHLKLDQAVLTAYAAVDPEGQWNADWAQVWQDTGAGQPLTADHALAARRAEIDQKVLANLLRLNLARAGQPK
jgi:hypothetical protein